MSISTITSKGQVTIPKKVRDRLRLRSGDRLDFRVEEDGTIRVFPIARKVSEVFGVLADRATKPYSAAETRRKLEQAFRDGKA
jgi:AbrB family looped-hinge helix DNA binding protein